MEKLKAAALYLIERILFIFFALMPKPQRFHNQFRGLCKLYKDGKNKVPDVYPQLKHTLFTILFYPAIFRRFCFYLRKHLKYLQTHIVEEIYEVQKVNGFILSSFII